MSQPQTQIMLDTRSPFTRADARRARISTKVLLGRRFQKILYDLYISADVVVTADVRARAALHVAGRGRTSAI